ncbi:hypothetical protein Poli38472_013893 [Pythium oligandrum]|uniref:Uncharacterized protein n=1 Tax=Pythium oligandrum TaxID=41045 RepID=A0A8K1C298_PYTOL|nr:hypothetical protein Poli38472_013893 [Pythium oligandrum]|eukprot:TMW55131.1 hypothetical protein Poli38472_013893 [Pythium oligandrum]
MPRLKQIATEAAEGVTAAQLLSASLHDQTQVAVRKKVAAACSAEHIVMASLLEDADTILASSNEDESGSDIEMVSMEECIERAVTIALRGQECLFFVANPTPLVKQLAHYVSIHQHPDSALRQIRIQRVRDVHIVLSELHRIQQTHQPPELVIVGPTSDLLGPFLTTTGLTPTGDGLLRLLHLALKRFQTITPTTRVCLMRPLFEKTL